jgi:CheY-like chemotaxis protein
MDSPPDPSFTQALSEVRHALRAPIAHVIGYAEILAEDLGERGPAESIRDLRVIATSGERLVAMVEEHLGPSKRALEELDLAEAQFQLRLQLNHIAGYTEMLGESFEEDGRVDLVADLDRVAAAEHRILELLDERLTPEAFRSHHVTRPASPGSAAVATASLQMNDLAAGGELLAVDADRANRELLVRRLERRGFSVTGVGSGEEGWDLAAAGHHDLVLMDLMFEDQRGMETLERLTTSPQTRAVPVIIVSAVDDPDRMVEAVVLGAEDYLVSPIRPVLLMARIGAALEMVRLRRQMARQLRIFISSPGDVIPERRVVKQVIQQLDDEYGHDVQLVPILWEEEPLVASDSFQSQIIEPHDTDVYIAILWSRIGSPLPKTITRPDGSQFESGTAYEFEDAMAGSREHGSPQMLMYRKTASPLVPLDDRQTLMDRLDQRERLDAYVAKWFRGTDGSYVGAFHEFSEPEELEFMLATHLRKLVDRWLAGSTTVDLDDD